MWAFPVVFLRFCWKLAWGLLFFIIIYIFSMSYFEACFEGKLFFKKVVFQITDLSMCS